MMVRHIGRDRGVAVHGVTGPAPRRVERMSVEQMLHWAFAREYARLDRGGDWSLPTIADSCAMIGRMADYGGPIDVCGGVSRPCDGADQVASVVQRTLRPDEQQIVVHHALTLSRPDWMPGAVPCCVPVDWIAPGGVRQAKTAAAGPAVARLNRQGRHVMEQPRMCPVTFSPHPSDIAYARRRYLNWVGAVLRLVPALGRLTIPWVQLTNQLPPTAPWKESC